MTRPESRQARITISRLSWVVTLAIMRTGCEFVRQRCVAVDAALTFYEASERTLCDAGLDAVESLEQFDRGNIEVAISATPESDAVEDSSVQLRLLGGFSLQVDGASVALPMHSRRVLAYLSLDHTQDFSCDRGVLAERLWPDAVTERSRASLRTALWRIRRAREDLVFVDTNTVRLGREVRVDVHQFRDIADRMMGKQADHCAESARMMARSTELLPGWDESWLVLAREQLRQARLHALEASAARLRGAQRFPEAIDAMLAIIAEEPFRESAHAALIEVYLSEGNACEAVRQFDTFAAMLWHELGIRPSDELCARVGLSVKPEARPSTGVAINRPTSAQVPVHAGR